MKAGGANAAPPDRIDERAGRTTDRPDCFCERSSTARENNRSRRFDDRGRLAHRRNDDGRGRARRHDLDAVPGVVAVMERGAMHTNGAARGGFGGRWDQAQASDHRGDGRDGQDHSADHGSFLRSAGRLLSDLAD
jgi:hypothetical protein